MGATTTKEYVVIELVALHCRALHEQRCALDRKDDGTVICSDEYIPSKAVCVLFPTKWIALPTISAREQGDRGGRTEFHRASRSYQLFEPGKA
jgi:hypothetical protein